MITSKLVFVLCILQSLALHEDCLVPSTKTPKEHIIKSLPQTIPMSLFLSSTEKLNIQILFKELDYATDSDHIVIASDGCLVHRKRNRNPKTEKVNCSDITAGWQQANISVTETAISIGPFLNYSLDYEISSFISTATNAMYCLQNSPTWMIKEKMPITIPLLGQENVNLTLISHESFSPILHVLGNSVSLSWKKESIAISKGPALPQGEYVIYIHNKTESIILTVHSEKYNCEASIINIGDPLDELGISSSKGNFYSILHLDNIVLYTEQKESIINHTQSEGNLNNTAVIVIMSVTGYIILAIIIGFQCLYIVKMKRKITQNKNEYLEDQPLLNLNDSKLRVKVDLKEIKENSSHLTEPRDNSTKIYKLLMSKDHHDSKKKVQKLSLGPVDPYHPTKVILILGETGAGKSSTINTMVNHLFGIELEDTERFVLIENETEGNHDKYESQTNFMTAYVLPFKSGMPNHCNYIIIDTPGFGDTRGFERDQNIMLQLENFLKQDYNINHIDVVGFVVKATAPRLTIAQIYIYDGLFSMFGKDVSHNIFLLVTHSGEEDPPVLQVLQDADIKYYDYYKLDNDVLYRSYNGGEADVKTFSNPIFIKFKWKMTETSLKNFFEKLPTVHPVSLSLTKIVLEENTRLRSVVGYLQKQIEEGLDKISQLNDKHTGSNNPEAARQIRQEIRTAEEHLVISIKDAQQLTARLKEIPLRLDPLSVHGYIEVLIKNEQMERKINYEERILVLEKLKEENEILKAVVGKDSPPGEGWLQYFQKLKED